MRTLQLNRRTFLTLAAASLVVPPLRAQDPERPVILVLTGDESARTAQIAATFKKACDFAVRMSYQIGDEADAGAFIADNIRGQPLSLVFAVGPVALKIAAREFSGTPVVYAEVTETALVAGRPEITGVSTRLEPRATIERLKQIHPGMTRIGLMHAGDRDPYWVHASATAQDLGVKPFVKVVSAAGEVENAFKSLLSETDLVWLQHEPRLWTGTGLAKVFHEASLQKFPICTFNRAHFEAANPPALVAYGHPDGIAATAAAMARNMLLDEPAPLYNYIAPMIVGNARAMRMAGLMVNAKTSAALDEVVGK